MRNVFSQIILLAISFAFISHAGAAGVELTPKQKEAVKNARSTEKYAAHPEWPLTVDEAVANLLELMTPELKEKVKNSKREELFSFHHSLGQGIRNRFGLWHGNFFLLVSCDAIIDNEFDPDKCSTVVIDALWVELNNGA